MHRMILAEGEPATAFRKYQLERDGCYEDFRGLTTVLVVTEAFLRQALREAFGRPDKPYLFIETAKLTYEGRPEEWGEDDSLSITMRHGGGVTAHHHIPFKDITAAQIF